MERLAQGRDNNFNLLRMIAASSVIVSHSYPLALGIGTPEPLSGFLPFTLGTTAVLIFFTVSGFFIMKSFDRKNSLGEFAWARVSRIAPALLLVSLVLAYGIEPWISFTGNPYPVNGNGPLWTLYYEVVCYAALAVGGIMGLYRHEKFPAFLLCYAIVYGAVSAGIVAVNTAYADLSLPFVLGMTAYHYRRRIPLKWVWLVPLILAAVLAIRTGILEQEACTIALGYGALCFGGINSPFLRQYNRLGDYSYGVYIYAWPIQQMIVYFVPGLSAIELILIAMPIIWALAALSWHFIEKPSLAWRPFARRDRDGAVAWATAKPRH